MRALSEGSTHAADSSVARSVTYLLLLSMIVFASAFALRDAFFSDIKPVSWDDAPPQNGALEAAFLLLTIENAAAIISVIAIVIVVVAWWRRTLATRERGE